MSFFRRTGPRFALEALAIVAAAVVTGFLHLHWWEIALAVLAVLGVSFVVEAMVSQPPRPVRPAPPAPAQPEPQPETDFDLVRVLGAERTAAISADAATTAASPAPPPPPAVEQPPPPLLPEPAAAASPPPEPEPEPYPAAAAPTAGGSLSRQGPWNIWDIERLLRERGQPDDEKQFLVHYLRDYAGPDGMLPAEFDDLVRESFANLFA